MPNITTTVVAVPIVVCCTCHQSFLVTSTWPLGVLEPTGRYHDDIEVMRITDQVVYECRSCRDAYFAELIAQEGEK